MAFVSRVYTDDKGFFWLCRLSSTFAAAAGTSATPTAEKNVDVHVKSSKSNNSYGVRPRFITVENKTGSPKVRHTFPVLEATTFDGYAPGEDITVATAVYTIVAKKSEKRDAR
jgi:hypothetical protein